MRVLMTVLTVVGSVAGTAQLWAVQLASEDGEVANQVARDLGIVVVGKVFNNVFLMRGSNEEKGDYESVKERELKKELDHHLIVWSEQQIGRRRTSGSERTNTVIPGEGYVSSVRQVAGVAGVRKNQRQVRNIGGLNRKIPALSWEFSKTDPLRWRQWYLGPGPGMQLNVTGLWEAGVRGGGISVAILDDGVELTHLDLALNYDPAASWDLLDSDPDPSPVPWSRHGTQLAGIIAATHSNGMCGMGVAPWSGVGAVRMLGYVVWDATEAAALAYERNHVDVYVAAWGPVDTGAVLEGPGVLAARAMRESIALGRRGRGSIYIWASGNGGFVGDDCNADGYANSIYTLTVSGSTRGGHPPSYAETCAATFVSTYSGDADEYDSEEEVNGVVTTDTGGVCTESFRGSSVSAAMVAGACALALDVNSKLGWRDMQHLMVRAATPHNPIPTQWNTNGIGLRYSHYFGFGSLNAGKMVDLARKWKPVPPAFRCYVQAPYQNITLVPDEPLVLSLSVSGCQIVQAEHIQVNASISAQSRGQIEVLLESPSGTVSSLLPKRPLDLSPYGIYNHPLMSVHMWGEDPRGTWKLRITYHNSSIIGPSGSKTFVDVPNMLHNWTLIIHGTEITLDRATPYHYYYTSEQLTRIIRRQKRTGIMTIGTNKTDNPRQHQEDRVRVEVQHWCSPITTRDKIHSYLFCRVRAPVPGIVSGITWYSGDREIVQDVVRRLSGKGFLAAKYPSILLIRETKTIDGNFTCRVMYDNEVFIQNLEVRGNYSTVPEVTEKTQVSVEGGNVELACDSLSPILRGTWTRNGERVKPTERVTINEERLTITGVENQDLGVYKCHVKSPRFNYSHNVSVTLLLAQGRSTLITHYAITSQPPLPPSLASTTSLCTSQENATDTSPNPLTSELFGAGPRGCPRPFKTLVEGHCLLVAPGEARSWNRARAQCQRRGGDLLVLQDAALMLAIMQLFHSQG
ncbi:Furin-like protease 1-like 1 [Homarus americanus]|uniref:Furin-like protease 1-like 1 n=2 Tax=Homarus americanus TaxID=6706 RepID=A0A8J5JRM8_HOMAM|nr:Furin-like protease 1-like 1 [Homarus americanus]